jgi:phosphoribosylformylglycinamidine cyclo-ligase
MNGNVGIMVKSVTYRESGVDIEAADDAVERIKNSCRQTFSPRVMGELGGFGGFFRLDYDEKLFRKNYREPVLVAGTDGVGTKLKLAFAMKKYDTVGIDLVAMCVNDILTCGAEPLFFLDYLAIDRLVPERIADIVHSISVGCRQADCSLLGGETAEMPGFYSKDEFDMAGFAVGVVEKRKLITSRMAEPGDVIIGLSSSGIHSNGYSLVRHIIDKYKIPLDRFVEDLEGTVGEVLLRPTRIYVKPILRLLSRYKVKQVVRGMSHITGSGLPGNLPRVIPPDCKAVLSRGSWPVPPVFDWLAKTGPVDEDEMFRTFNMGVGYCLIVRPAFANSIMKFLRKAGEEAWLIGKVRPRGGSSDFEISG